MQNNIRNTNLRFNLDKEQQRRAWEYLQTILRTSRSKNSLKKTPPLSRKKNFVLNQNNTQNCWIPESSYVLIFGIS